MGWVGPTQSFTLNSRELNRGRNSSNTEAYLRLCIHVGDVPPDLPPLRTWSCHLATVGWEQSRKRFSLMQNEGPHPSDLWDVFVSRHAVEDCNLVTDKKGAFHFIT